MVEKEVAFMGFQFQMKGVDKGYAQDIDVGKKFPQVSSSVIYVSKFYVSTVMSCLGHLLWASNYPLGQSGPGYCIVIQMTHLLLRPSRSATCQCLRHAFKPKSVQA